MGGMQPHHGTPVPSNQPPTMSQQITDLKTQIADLKRVLNATANELKSTRDDLKDLSLAYTKLSMQVATLQCAPQTDTTSPAAGKTYSSKEAFEYIKKREGCVICTTTDINLALVRKKWAKQSTRSCFPLAEGWKSGMLEKNSNNLIRITEKGMQYLVSYFGGGRMTKYLIEGVFRAVFDDDIDYTDWYCRGTHKTPEDVLKDVASRNSFVHVNFNNFTDQTMEVTSYEVVS